MNWKARTCKYHSGHPICVLSCYLITIWVVLNRLGHFDADSLFNCTFKFWEEAKQTSSREIRQSKPLQGRCSTASFSSYQRFRPSLTCFCGQAKIFSIEAAWPRQPNHLAFYPSLKLYSSPQQYAHSILITSCSPSTASWCTTSISTFGSGHCSKAQPSSFWCVVVLLLCIWRVSSWALLDKQRCSSKTDDLNALFLKASLYHCCLCLGFAIMSVYWENNGSSANATFLLQQIGKFFCSRVEFKEFVLALWYCSYWLRPSLSNLFWLCRSLSMWLISS